MRLMLCIIDAPCTAAIALDAVGEKKRELSLIAVAYSHARGHEIERQSGFSFRYNIYQVNREGTPVGRDGRKPSPGSRHSI